MRRVWWGFCLVMVTIAFSVQGNVGAGPLTPSAPLRTGPTLSQGERGSGTKYDPQFGNALEKARAQHASKRWLDCVIRVSHAPTGEDLAQLKSSGFQPRSIIDTIVTGRIRVRNAQKLIDLPLVVSIEGGGMGGPKRTQGLK